MSRWLRWGIPAFFVILGLAVFGAGFGYDLAFAGLPYQDPTPEMEAYWRYHSRVASLIASSGGAILLIGLGGLAFVGVWSLIRRPAKLGNAPDPATE